MKSEKKVGDYFFPEILVLKCVCKLFDPLSFQISLVIWTYCIYFNVLLIVILLCDELKGFKEIEAASFRNPPLHKAQPCTNKRIPLCDVRTREPVVCRRCGVA